MAGFKAAARRYYRLTKPGIVYGNSLTAAGGFLFAAHGYIDSGRLVVTLLCIAAIMAAGCVYNNVLDQAIDARMQRTRQRALVAGTISDRQALVFATILGSLGLNGLVMAINLLTAVLGFFALFAYVVLYGIGKRRTIWGTLIGTISGALPPVGGYTAVTGQLDLNALLIFLILVAWQMSHFYAIAMYRLADYRAAQLPVWPVERGMASTKTQIVLFIGLFLLACLALTGFGTAGYSFLIVMALVALVWLGRTLRGWRMTDDAKWARGVFGDSLLTMLVLSVMLSVGSSLR